MKRLNYLGYALVIGMASCGGAVAASYTSAGETYTIVADPGVTWQEAETLAQAAAGNLALIHNAADNAAIENLVYQTFGSAGLTGTEAWLGGTFPGQPSGGSRTGWTWSDGSNWDYSNWNANEPNNVGGVETGLALNRYSDGTWNDEGSWMSGIGGYVLETRSVPDGGSSAAMLGGLLGLFGMIRRKARL